MYIQTYPHHCRVWPICLSFVDIPTPSTWVYIDIHICVHSDLSTSLPSLTQVSVKDFSTRSTWVYINIHICVYVHSNLSTSLPSLTHFSVKDFSTRSTWVCNNVSRVCNRFTVSDSLSCTYTCNTHLYTYPYIHFSVKDFSIRSTWVCNYVSRVCSRFTVSDSLSSTYICSTHLYFRLAPPGYAITSLECVTALLSLTRCLAPTYAVHIYTNIHTSWVCNNVSRVCTRFTVSDSLSCTYICNTHLYTYPYNLSIQ